MATNVLTLQGSSLINAQGQPVILRGFGLGGWMINRLVRHIMFSEPLLEEFGALFKDLQEPEIDTLLQSFRFKNCVQRSELAETLKIYSTL